ncbi:MAG: hypothetical protein QOK02_330 [Mycobacterium sp.]|jgi:hypothetical protein|nr:hypothetical protein [Mycobacterium sp.]
MSVSDGFESGGKATFLRAANAPILAVNQLVVAGTRLTTRVGEPERQESTGHAGRGYGGLRNPIGPPPAQGP